jgi:hypothetical protein
VLVAGAVLAHLDVGLVCAAVVARVEVEVAEIFVAHLPAVSAGRVFAAQDALTLIDSLIRLFLYDLSSCSSRSCSCCVSRVFFSAHAVSISAAASWGAMLLNSSTSVEYSWTFLPFLASAMASR